MNTKKKLGIWMDHASAHLIKFSNDETTVKAVSSKFSHREKEHSLGKNENLSHNKEQHEQADYYKKLGDVIREYDDVILFGPTEAKTELLNTLRADHRFEKIKIETKSADKMNEQQQEAFVTDYFK